MSWWQSPCNTVSRLQPEGDRKTRSESEVSHTEAEANGRASVIDSESWRSAAGALVMVWGHYCIWCITGRRTGRWKRGKRGGEERWKAGEDKERTRSKISWQMSRGSKKGDEVRVRWQRERRTLRRWYKEDKDGIWVSRSSVHHDNLHNEASP